MTYDQLPQSPAPGVCLFCPVCQSTYSACRSDYCGAPPKASPGCVDCGVSLTLAREAVRYVRVSPAKAEARR